MTSPIETHDDEPEQEESTVPIYDYPRDADALAAAAFERARAQAVGWRRRPLPTLTALAFALLGVARVGSAQCAGPPVSATFADGFTHGGRHVYLIVFNRAITPQTVLVSILPEHGPKLVNLAFEIPARAPRPIYLPVFTVEETNFATEVKFEAGKAGAAHLSIWTHDHATGYALQPFYECRSVAVLPGGGS